MLSNKEKELDILTEFLKSFENICISVTKTDTIDPELFPDFFTVCANNVSSRFRFDGIHDRAIF